LHIYFLIKIPSKDIEAIWNENNTHILTPWEVGIKLTKTDCPSIEEKHHLMTSFPYPQVIDNLMHIIIHTNLIAFI
jgi:hypothetical protein